MDSRHHERSGFLSREDLDRQTAEYAEATDPEVEELVVAAHGAC